MDKYVLSQLLLGIFMPIKEKQRGIIISYGINLRNIAFEALKRPLHEQNFAVIEIDTNDSMQDFFDFIEELNSPKMIIAEQPLMIEKLPTFDDIKFGPIEDNPKEHHKFISKNSGGHVAKPGTKEYRAFKNNFNKNSYKKKHR